MKVTDVNAKTPERLLNIELQCETCGRVLPYMTKTIVGKGHSQMAGPAGEHQAPDIASSNAQRDFDNQLKQELSLESLLGQRGKPLVCPSCQHEIASLARAAEARKRATTTKFFAYGIGIVVGFLVAISFRLITERLLNLSLLATSCGSVLLLIYVPILIAKLAETKGYIPKVPSGISGTADLGVVRCSLDGVPFEVSRPPYYLADSA